MAGARIECHKKECPFFALLFVPQMILDAAIVGAKERHEREAGEELRLREDLGAKATGILRKRPLTHREGDQDHLSGGRGDLEERLMMSRSSENGRN